MCAKKVPRGASGTCAWFQLSGKKSFQKIVKNETEQLELRIPRWVRRNRTGVQMKQHLAFTCGLLLALTTGARAGVVFSDDFNSYAYQLNWTPPANWTAPGPGTVDLIGQTTTQTQFDLQPGNGGYVDLNGSNGTPGTLQTDASFAAGTYTLSFDLAGNARNDVAKTTVISLGSFSQSITLDSSDPFHLYTFTFSTNGGQLSFSDQAAGNGNIGNLLDNVTLATAIPEAKTWAMVGLGFLGLGLMAYRGNERTRLRLA